MIHYYDKPIASTIQRISDSTIVNDSQFFQLLKIEEGIEESFSYGIYRYDSILLAASELAELPPYNPYKLTEKDEYGEGEFEIIITRYLRSFGMHKVDLVYIRTSRSNSEVSKRSFSVDADCNMFMGPKQLTANCFERTHYEEMMLFHADVDSIASWYQKYDIGRTSYYDNQSKLMCDGYTYSIRYLDKWTDKRTTVECPGDYNPIYLFYQMVDNI